MKCWQKRQQVFACGDTLAISIWRLTSYGVVGIIDNTHELFSSVLFRNWEFQIVPKKLGEEEFAESGFLYSLVAEELVSWE